MKVYKMLIIEDGLCVYEILLCYLFSISAGKLSI